MDALATKSAVDDDDNARPFLAACEVMGDAKREAELESLFDIYLKGKERPVHLFGQDLADKTQLIPPPSLDSHGFGYYMRKDHIDPDNYEELIRFGAASSSMLHTFWHKNEPTDDNGLHTAQITMMWGFRLFNRAPHWAAVWTLELDAGRWRFAKKNPFVYRYIIPDGFSNRTFLSPVVGAMREKGMSCEQVGKVQEVLERTPVKYTAGFFRHAFEGKYFDLGSKRLGATRRIKRTSKNLHENIERAMLNEGTLDIPGRVYKKWNAQCTEVEGGVLCLDTPPNMDEDSRHMEAALFGNTTDTRLLYWNLNYVYRAYCVVGGQYWEDLPHQGWEEPLSCGAGWMVLTAEDAAWIDDGLLR